MIRLKRRASTRQWTHLRTVAAHTDRWTARPNSSRSSCHSPRRTRPRRIHRFCRIHVSIATRTSSRLTTSTNKAVCCQATGPRTFSLAKSISSNHTILDTFPFVWSLFCCFVVNYIFWIFIINKIKRKLTLFYYYYYYYIITVFSFFYFQFSVDIFWNIASFFILFLFLVQIKCTLLVSFFYFYFQYYFASNYQFCV